MNTNNLLTYLLYGLLGLLICLAGYKACEMQKEKKQKAAEEAELQKTLRDMGIVEDDTTATTGSSYTPTETTPTATTTAPKSDPQSSATTTTATTTQTATAPKAAVAPKTTTTAPATTAKAPETNKPTVPKLSNTATSGSKTTSKGVAAVKGPGTGRWAVRAGTFGSKENARKRLEQVIKAGYPNAEISPASNGQYAVVVFRSNDKVAAQKIMDKLEDKGIDAAVFDRQK